MMYQRRLILALAATTMLVYSTGAGQAAEPLRAGIIGCDTSHAVAYTKILNGQHAVGPLSEVRVVAAYPGGSKDIPASRDRIAGFTEALRKSGIEIVDSIDALLKQVDVVLLESIDGRTHLAQARPVLESGKPLFIDKPVAGTLADAVEIFQLAKKHSVPCWSSSPLRYTPGIRDASSDTKIGSVVGCAAYSPCTIEPHHPDLFWYGIHGVETLFTVMGTGCKSVTRVHTEGTDFVTGVWKDGRVGTFRGIRTGKRAYGAIIYGTKSNLYVDRFGGYEPLVEEIARFFKTRKPPVTEAETLEIFAFMEAADESKRQGGTPVAIDRVLETARKQVARRRAEDKPENPKKRPQ